MPENELRTADFDYDLPRNLIATRPLDRRDASRLMKIDRAAGSISHHTFADFPSMLNPGDLVVLNDTRVVRARFFSDDRRIELLRLDRPAAGRWRCLVRPGRRMRVGNLVRIGGSVGTVEALCRDGSRIIVWDAEPDEETHGHLALPHYLGREDDSHDLRRYQTVYASAEKSGAIAAPTAGLHFTPELLAKVPHAFVTLHVGAGTFQPVRAEFINDHTMHSERFAVSHDAAETIAGARRVIAVGTTVARVLEHVAAAHGSIVESAGETSIFIRPGFSFSVVGGLLTNFHLPRSTLLMLVSGFAGIALIRRAYAEAIAAGYRFYSYGDCMLIL
jgi:S-adenosylmethionine:tRNA ribosyltransferase-isomerase